MAVVRTRDKPAAAPVVGRWRRLRHTADRGNASVEAVIIVPVIVVLTLLVVQFVLVWHGTHVAQAAAQTAARSAAAYRADPGTGQAAGDAYLADVAPNLLPGRTVTVTGDAVTATAVVHAQVLTILPFAAFDVQETATAPRERFVQNAGGP
jgi:Flp pilus assembly protein TadG